MGQVKPKTFLVKRQRQIAATVRGLRQQRKWTQAELAKRLGLSQNRLSEIERGAGSFSAEQLLLLLALFNVPVSAFTDEIAEPDLALQNALARLGASHLHEADHVLPSEQLREVGDVIREVLVGGSPRLLTGTAPVLVLHARSVNLRKIQVDLQRLGFENRLPWLIDNTLRALALLREDTPRKLVPAIASLQLFLNLSENARPASVTIDVLDPTIRTEKTVAATRRRSSEISRRWGVVTMLSPEDFVEPLKVAFEST
ncbi:MAG: helix-turn-helix domain-containing protein [Kofleriaceae bacterium]